VAWVWCFQITEMLLVIGNIFATMERFAGGIGILFEVSCLRVPLADRVLAFVAAIGSNIFPC
jgi:hypothetical protein